GGSLRASHRVPGDCQKRPRQHDEAVPGVRCALRLLPFENEVTTRRRPHHEVGGSRTVLKRGGTGFIGLIVAALAVAACLRSAPDVVVYTSEAPVFSEPVTK